MLFNPLILAYKTLSCRITKFVDSEDVKRMVSYEPTGDVRYSINGSPIDAGIQYEEHRVWTFEAAHLSPEQVNAIELMAQAQNRDRRAWTSSRDYGIILHDWITPYRELGSTRTRAIAVDGARVGVVQPIGQEGIIYPAQWRVRFVEFPQFSNVRTNGSFYNCRIQLKELERVNA